MKSNKEEKIYRKWVGICQQSDTTVPLVMTFVDDDVHINMGDTLLLKTTMSEFMEESANTIIHKMGVPIK